MTYRRPPAALRLLRTVAAACLWGLAGLVAREALRAAGFEIRWDARDGSRPAGVADGGDVAGRKSPVISAGTGPAGTAPSTSPSPSTPPVAGTRASDGRPPDLGPRRPGAGRPATIDFEPRGGRPCAVPCPVSDAWEEEGLVVGFRSWTARSERPWVLDVGNFVPEDASRYGLGPALDGDRGLEVGRLRLDLPYRPRRVSFTVYGPDLIGRFDIAAWSDEGPLALDALRVAPLGRYRPAGRGLFRAERITFEWPDGIARVTLDGWGPPGHILIVDDVRIEP